MDLRHLVHEGIDNTRYTGTDVGKLAFYGQGNCHHLASVGAALLYPFGKYNISHKGQRLTKPPINSSFVKIWFRGSSSRWCCG